MDTEDNHRIDKILELLEKAKARPRIYIGSDESVHDVELFFQGFASACIALDQHYTVDIERQVLIEYGWERRAQSVSVQMRERGMDDKSIVQELFMLEIEKWQKYKESHSSPNQA